MNVKLSKEGNFFRVSAKNLFTLFIWRQAVNSSAYDQKLLLGRSNELEAVLKSLAISNFSANCQWFSRFRRQEFEFDKFAERDLAGHGRAQAAFAQILGTSMESFLCLDDQPEIQKESCVFASGCPVFRLATLHPSKHYHSSAQEREVSCSSAQRACSAITGSGSDIIFSN